MLHLLFSLSLLPLISCGIWPGHIQSAAATGRLTCNGQPAIGVLVKLKDYDLFDPDDKMDQSMTNPAGIFALRGWTKEWTTIEPYVSIYHKCNYNGLCVRKLSLDIPESMVTHGMTVPNSIWNVGQIELSQTWGKESYDCIH